MNNKRRRTVLVNEFLGFWLFDSHVENIYVDVKYFNITRLSIFGCWE